jgi:hypothetical protein
VPYRWDVAARIGRVIPAVISAGVPELAAKPVAYTDRHFRTQRLRALAPSSSLPKAS